MSRTASVETDIDGAVLVGAAVDLIRFVERLDTLADEDVEAIGLVADNFKANQHVPERVLGGGDRHLRFAPRGVHEMLDFLVFHSVTSVLMVAGMRSPCARPNNMSMSTCLRGQRCRHRRFRREPDKMAALRPLVPPWTTA